MNPSRRPPRAIARIVSPPPVKVLVRGERRSQDALRAYRVGLRIVEQHGEATLRRLIEAFEAGTPTVGQLAREVGVSRATMWEWKCALGVETRQYRVAPEVEAIAGELAEQPDLRCPKCGRVLEWACWGDVGSACCTAHQTQRLPVDAASLCTFRGEIRRQPDGTVRLTGPEPIATRAR